MAVVIRMVCKGCSHSVYVLVAVIRLCGHSHMHVSGDHANLCCCDGVER